MAGITLLLLMERNSNIKDSDNSSINDYGKDNIRDSNSNRNIKATKIMDKNDNNVNNNDNDNNLTSFKCLFTSCLIVFKQLLLFIEPSNFFHT